jgi:hypothetical protein
LISAWQHNDCDLLSADVASQGADANWDSSSGFRDGESWFHPTVLGCPTTPFPLFLSPHFPALKRSLSITFDHQRSPTAFLATEKVAIYRQKNGDPNGIRTATI